MELHDKILVTGAGGLVGTNLVSHFQQTGFKNVIGIRSTDCDFTNRKATHALFSNLRPTYAFHMAGFVRGIMGNMRNQAEAYLRNILINTHVIEAAQLAGVKKIVAMGTVAMYPDPLPRSPVPEDDLWKGAPHFSEYGYAQAKRAMLAQLEAYHESYGTDYACAISTNLYGPHDRFDTVGGHVIPSLIKKFYNARQEKTPVKVWGDGSAGRDFLHVADAVRGLHLIMDKLSGAVNLATGIQHRIREVVDILADTTGLQNKVVWDTSKPNGQLMRSYDVSKIAKAGFTCMMPLERGLQETYDWYARHAGTSLPLERSA